ncbi:DUF4157 domain-containing protein [Moorena sp. SIO3H5]|uniref:eCIS core domain-containing protein n=1 Tax=Moorena sp. SIO3H5 TaxID=2607834 RepID=UPI0025F31713|nr:DUF4157 domain-containing protein [Moorena sp. SIO3H5]
MGYQRASQTKNNQTTPKGKTVQAKPTPLATHSPVHPLLKLQSTIGNQAVNRLIQTKMQVGEPDDVYEKEADSVAAQVMRMPAPPVQNQTEEEEIQTKPIALQLQSDEEEIQTKANPGQTPAVSPNLETKIQSRRGTGQPLPDSTRAFMEPRFGADFSGVRVHTDSTAVQMNKELGAQAFTHGRDIFYGAGKSPGKNSLTAHELTHTIQQTGGIEAKVIDQQGNGVNPESHTLVKDTDIKPEVEGENTVNTEVVAPEETAAPKAETAPKLETNATSVSSRVSPEKNQEAMAPEAANQGIKAEVNQETTATPAEATPQETTPASPESDPDFQAVVAKAKGVANKQKQHAPASTKAKEAQAAAVSPDKEIESKAQANQVGEMAQAPTPGFNAAAFKAKLMERIKSAAPETLEEADQFKESNKLASVKSQMQDTVKQEQTASQAPLEQKAKQAPDTSSIKPKSVTPLPANQAGAVTKNIGADKAIPKAKGQGEVKAPLQESSQKLDQQMAEADVTTEQLAKSNEPQFQTALAAKQEAQTNASQAPQGYRQFEQDQLAQAQGEAATTAGKQLQGMHGSRAQLLAQVTNQQIKAKGKDEQERAKVAGDIQKIYNQTKTKVEDTIKGLDGKVNQEFDAGANQATKAFENYVDKKMRAYKAKRYSGDFGWYLWGKDKLLGLPSEVNAFYQQGRQLYLEKMDVVLDKIVNIIGTALTDAKAEIAKGRQEIKEYVAQLPENLKTVGQQAATDIQSQFNELEQNVDSKQDQLINTLAQKYNEKLQAVDARIDEMKAANQGLVDKAANAITGVIDTINKLKDLLLSVLSKAASLIGNIIKDPIGFLGNLISGIKQGFENFVANIGQHLQAGLIGWLTGSLGPMGIQLPDDIFSLPGIFSLVTQVLGLTFTYIRGKSVKLFGEPVVAGMEKSVEIFQVLRDRGPMGLWEHVKEQFNDLKQTVIEQIKSMVVTEVISAGVKWVLSLLNPASAFVKAAMAIYDIIMFFVNRGSQVLELVNAVVDAVSAIASGAVGGAAKLVENALAKAVPVVIGFLASLLGIGGLAKKVENIIGKIRERIDQAIDKVLLKARGLLGKAKKGANKVKETVLNLIKWWTKKKSFKDKTGHSHELYYKGSLANAKLYVASFDPKMLDKFFDEKLKEAEGQTSFTKSDVEVAKEYYDKKVRPLEIRLREIDKVYQGGSGGSKLSAEKKAKDINANKQLVQELERALSELSNQHLKKLFGATVEDYPPPKLPVMADNKKASSFTADYIVRGEKHKITTGTESGKHVGNLDGWSQLQESKLTHQAQWVRMHLLPHKLGGNAVDSNLTPARGSHNTRFSSAVEQPAIKAAVEGNIKDNKPIWYRFLINYYSGKASPFPKYLKAEWGFYESTGGQLKRGPLVKSFSQSPEKPELTPVTPNLNDPDVTAGDITRVTDVDRGFVLLLLNVRKENGESLGTTEALVQSKMEDKYVTNHQGNRQFKFGVKDFDNRLEKVLGAIRAGKLKLK